jgi:lipoyl(octanoyl) transferase
VAIETLAAERSGSTPEPGPIAAAWLGRIDYNEALALQKRLVAERAAGTSGDRLLLLEHPPVLTLGRGADPSHVRATPAHLAARGIEVVRVERGGEVTYHGPGQLVAYPIVGLATRGLLIRPFVRALETALI